MLTLAIAGLGTVGTCVVRQLKEQASLVAMRAGMPIHIAAVTARDRNKLRSCDLEGIQWVDHPHELLDVPNLDCVVELMGGSNGPALELAEATLKKGKHLITANKALLASHGPTLARFAEDNNVQLSYEAAVVGGIPIIKTLREGLAGDSISVVRGILNGTCNSILSRMRDGGISFSEALKEAQKNGYAEAEPANDIDGHDTANKLALLAALSFGVEPDLGSVLTEGIRRVTPLDLKFAEDLDCRIKLLGVARMTEAGLEQRVGPSLVPKNSPLASVDGPLNAVFIRSQRVGDLTLEGQGAGGMPTANAVIADIVDLARGHRCFAFSQPAATLKKAKRAPVPAARFYMRLDVTDKPGVVADISAILRDEAISIESLLQRSQAPGNTVPVVITTHAATMVKMHQALEKISCLATVKERPCLMQIED